MTDPTRAESAQFDGLPTFRAAVVADLRDHDALASLNPDRATPHEGELVLFEAAGETKLRLGVEKYGPDAWRNHDMLAEAVNELVDLGNYAFLRWRQTVAMPRNETRDMLAEAMVALYVAAFEQWTLLTEMLAELDRNGEPRSLTGANFVGVQPPEFTEV
jgi:hypothetical protein